MSVSTPETGPCRYVLRLLLPVFVVLLVAIVCETGMRAAGLRVRLPWGKNQAEYNAVYTKAVRAQELGKKVCAFIGDSRVEWSVAADTVQAYLESQGVRDVEVFNLASPGVNVQSIMKRLQEVSFYPDYVVVGYSHLSFYWSKQYQNLQPELLGPKDLFQIRLDTWWRYRFAIAGYSWREIKQFITTGEKPPLSWLSNRVIMPRGRAHVKYAIPAQEAIDVQKEAYGRMYQIEMTPQQVDRINQAFFEMVDDFKAHGATTLLIRMPLGGWALTMEKEHDAYPFDRLAAELGTAALDLNELPGALELRSYDDLHIAPPSHKTVSLQIAEHLLLPVFR